MRMVELQAADVKRGGDTTYKPQVGDHVIIFAGPDKGNPGILTQYVGKGDWRVKLAPGVYVKVDEDDMKKLPV